MSWESGGIDSIVSTLGKLPKTNSDGSCTTALDYVGKVIADAEMFENQVGITFSDGVRIIIYDDGQSCCETRYMSTDDDLKTLIGYQLLDIVSKYTANNGCLDDDLGNCQVREICFVEIVTTDGFVTLDNHNEHNGCYSGFSLVIKELPSGWQKL